MTKERAATVVAAVAASVGAVLLLRPLLRGPMGFVGPMGMAGECSCAHDGADRHAAEYEGQTTWTLPLLEQEE